MVNISKLETVGGKGEFKIQAILKATFSQNPPRSKSSRDFLEKSPAQLAAQKTWKQQICRGTLFKDFLSLAALTLFAAKNYA